MSNLVRFGVSLDKGLLERFDRIISKRGYQNRSEAIRDLIREKLVEEAEWEKDDKVTIGTITFVYDHERRELLKKITHLQHSYLENIIASTHIHLDEHNCLEVLIVKGKSSKIKEIADHLISTKGVKLGKLTLATTGKELS